MAKKQSGFKAIAAAGIGNALEWYDFSVFAFFATYISKNFFIDNDASSALINTFILFGAGFLARPLGAIIIGAYGDKMGRKAAITLTIAMMAIGTFIIFVTPPISYIGIFAPILLLIARLFQGFSTGGEIGGAAAFLIEHAPENKKIFYASFLQASMGMSNILAALMGIFLTTFFTESQILDYAWRFAFLFGLLIVPVGFYIRNTLDETPEFKNLNQNNYHSPLKVIFQGYCFKIIMGILFSILWTSCVYTFIIYMPTYYVNHNIGLNFTQNQSFWASFIGNIFLVGGCIVFARIAQKIGVYKMLFLSIILLASVPFLVLYVLFLYTNFYVLFISHILLCILVSIFAGIAPSILATYYPTFIRSSALAISYNIAAIFFAGFTPAIVNYLVAFNIFAPAYWVLLACIFAFIGAYFMKRDKGE
ncbi:TPA: MFS transporter [Campylobacter coli]|nr:MFS transporter [Campylobacter coli]HEB9431524.1 MFS transporter [Campylobacter coli]